MMDTDTDYEILDKAMRAFEQYAARRVVQNDIKDKCQELIQILIGSGQETVAVDPCYFVCLCRRPGVLKITTNAVWYSIGGSSDGFEFNAKTNELDQNGDSLEQILKYLRKGREKLSRKLNAENRKEMKMLNRCLLKQPIPLGQKEPGDLWVILVALKASLYTMILTAEAIQLYEMITGTTLE